MLFIGEVSCWENVQFWFLWLYDVLFISPFGLFLFFSSRCKLFLRYIDKVRTIIFKYDFPALLLLCHLFYQQVSPEEMEVFEEIKSILGERENKDSNFIAPFPLLTKNAVESLRYRAEVSISQVQFLNSFATSVSMYIIICLHMMKSLVACFLKISTWKEEKERRNYGVWWKKERL